jgi:hypothetical protein
MTRYKFEQFLEPIDCVEWEILQVVDGNNGTALATIKMTDVNGRNYGIDLPDFDYGNPNRDIDLPKVALTAFITNELKNYEA